MLDKAILWLMGILMRNFSEGEQIIFQLLFAGFEKKNN